MDVFNLAAKITLDTSEYEKGLNSSQSKISTFGQKLKGGLSTVTKVGGVALTAASAAVVAFGKSSIDAGKRFDTSMSQVAATMGKTMEEVEKETGSVDTAFGSFTGNLREYAQFMGKNTAFSASQAADALNYMALAGYDTQKSMNMLPNVLNLAAAGNMELATASDMVTDAQSALGLSMDETTEMVDKMAKASSKSNTSVAQLGEAYLTVGGTAKSLKGGTTELSTVLGLLADNGIKGAEGGTKLRNMILSLSAPTDDAAKTMKSLGLEVFDSEGNMRSMKDIMGDLNTAMDGMTDEQKTKAISSIFNKADIKAVNALLGTSAERWDELTGYIEDSTGAAQEMANTQLDNLAGDVTLFKSALEGAQIAISDALTPSLRGLVQEGTSGLQRLTDAFTEGGFDQAMDVAADLISEWTAKLVEGIPKLIEIGGGLLLALADGIIVALPSVVKGLGTLGGKLVDSIRRGMAKSVGKLANGFGKDLKKKSNEFRKSASVIIDSIGGQAKQFIELGTMLIENFMSGLTEAFPNLIKNGTEIIKKIHTGIINAIPGLIEAGGRIINSIVGFIMTALPTLMQSGADIIKNLLNGITKNLPKIAESIQNVLTNIGTTISNGLPNIVSKGSEVLQSIASGITSAIPQIGSAIGGIITTIGGWITSNAANFAENGGKIWDAIVSGISTAIDTIGDALSGIGGKILDWINGDGLQGLTEDGSTLWEKIKEGFTNALSDIGQLVMKVIVGIGTWITQNYDSIAQAGKNILSYIVEGVVAVASDIATGMLALIGQAVMWVINNRSQILAVGKTILTTIVNGIASVVDTVVNGFVDFISNIGQWFTDHETDITNFGHDIIDYIKDGIGDWISNIKDGFVNLVSTIKDKISNTSFLTIGSAIIKKIKEAIVTFLSNIGLGFVNLPSTIKTKTDSLSFASVGRSIINGIKNSFDVREGSLADKLIQLIQGAVNAASAHNYQATVHVTTNGNLAGGGGKGGFAKALHKPYLFNKATVFGKYSGEDLIAGEAGPEMLLGVNKLNSMLFESVQGGMQSMMGQFYEMASGMSVNGGGSSILEQRILEVLEAYLPQLSERQIVLDTGVLAGAVAGGVDTELGGTAVHKRRYAAG